MMKTLLAIFAHPDDESFGIGGTLARYAHAGVAAHYVCATRGESGTIDPALLHGYADAGELRSHELECASRELGLADVRYLGYRDSGMPGSADNQHPNSLFSAPIDEVAARISQAISDLKPDVIITHDRFGGYGHPDHIKLHHCTVRAYDMLYGLRVGDGAPGQDAGKDAGKDAGQDAGKDAGAARAPRLYVTSFPMSVVRLGVRLLPLLGQNPRRFGRNQDIDLVEMATWVVPVTAKLDVGAYAAYKERASACHLSQRPVSSQGNVIINLLLRRSQKTEAFCRLYPPVRAGEPIERDLGG